MRSSSAARRRHAIPRWLPVLALLPGCSVPFQSGLEVLEAAGFAPLRGKRVAVVTNPTGTNRELVPLLDLLARAPGVHLSTVFAPEHGLDGAAAAGEGVGDQCSPQRAVPVYSLYGKRRRPDPAQLEGTDVILFDIQDIGVRTYTYLSTLLEVLRAAASSGVEVWVLDRPVPIGADRFEGPVLAAGWESFVGPHSVPLRHGLTAGEFALMASAELEIPARLRVVPMRGYRRDLAFSETGLTWVAPSPNIPTVEAALVYAGTVLVEGTNLSEGRGTTRPFQLAGAPWLDGERLAADLRGLDLAGVVFRTARFSPDASKYRGEECGGVEIHVRDPRLYRAVETALHLLARARALHPDRFEFHPSVFDRLAGGPQLRQALEAGLPVPEIVASWERDLEIYRLRRRPFLLY